MPDLFLFYIYTSVWQQTRTVLGCCAFLVPLAWKLEKNFSLASQLNWLKMEFFTLPVLQILRAFWTSSLPLWQWSTSSLRKAFVPHDFSTAKSRAARMSYGAVWGRKNAIIISPDRHVISFAVNVTVCVPLLHFVCEWKSEEGWRSGCLGRICPCSPSPRSLELWPGQAEMVSWRRLRFGGKLPGALIKLMPFVDSLCMNASIPACQRALSQSRKPNEHWLRGLY